MKKIIRIIILLALLAAAATANLPQGGADPCEALKKAMDDAFAKYSEADKAWQKTVDDLIKAMGDQDDSEKAIDKAVKAAQKAATDWQNAVQAAKDCLAKGRRSACSGAVRAARNASTRMAHAQADADNLTKLAPLTDPLADAKKAMNEAAKKMNAAQDAYEKAARAYDDCRSKREVVFSLQPGEEIKQAESTIGLSVDFEDIILILTKGGEKNGYTVVRDGERSKPFTDFKAAMEAAYKDKKNNPGGSRDCAVYKPGPAPADARFGNKSQGRSEILTYKDQSFGPYEIVFSTRFVPDGSKGYFLASNKDKAWFGCSDGRKISFGGVPGEFKFSPDGKSAAVMVEGTMSISEMEGLAKLPPDKMAAAFKTMEQKFLYTIDGVKYGPFDKNFGGSSVWFVPTSNDLYFRVNDDIFRNGKKFLTLESFNNCSFYPSIDGKSYAYFNYSEIAFSDGTKYPEPLDVVVYEEDGTTVFKWICLENGRDLVVYRKRT
jgi:hypothetical protein